MKGEFELFASLFGRILPAILLLIYTVRHLAHGDNWLKVPITAFVILVVCGIFELGCVIGRNAVK